MLHYIILLSNEIEFNAILFSCTVVRGIHSAKSDGKDLKQFNELYSQIFENLRLLII